jgi:hypothetical protein
MSTAAVKTIPQPLNGTEIKRGIAVRMTQGLPADVAESLREQIVAGLGKTCSLMATSAYAKFKAKWRLHYWSITPQTANYQAAWWVDYELDDFGRVTKGGIGGGTETAHSGVKLSGVIDEVPPDRFRRETDQPIPKPTELKPPEPEKSTMSHAPRGKGKGRRV